MYRLTFLLADNLSIVIPNSPDVEANLLHLLRLFAHPVGMDTFVVWPF